jgi:hypothetical protein
MAPQTSDPNAQKQLEWGSEYRKLSQKATSGKKLAFPQKSILGKLTKKITRKLTKNGKSQLFLCWLLR